MDRGQARLLLRLCGVGGVTAAAYGGWLIERRLHQVSEERRDEYVARWAAAQVRLFGVRLVLSPSGWSARGWPALPRLVVANHRSALDIMLMLHLFGGHILARGDMAGWPVVGPMIRAAGTLFVDRDETMSRAAAIRRLGEPLGRGRTVIVFPEGTTYPGDEVRPFHKGAFLPILRARGEVVPVGLAYGSAEAFYGDEDFVTHLKRLLRQRETRVAVAVGRPISAAGEGRASLEALAEQTHEAVQALVRQARG